MLEKLLQAGSSAAWLPRNEATSPGDGSLCEKNIAVQQQGDCRFQYVPFVKNGINGCDQLGDVISYNFTGCIMATFVPKGGVRKVCHVSTGEGQDCLSKWKAIKDKASGVFEFKPSDFIDAGGEPFAGCYGLITKDLRTFAITITSRGGALTVANIKTAHLLRP